VITDATLGQTKRPGRLTQGIAAPLSYAEVAGRSIADKMSEMYMWVGISAVKRWEEEM